MGRKVSSNFSDTISFAVMEVEPNALIFICPFLELSSGGSVTSASLGEIPFRMTEAGTAMCTSRRSRLPR